jgi:DNA-binding response OmpR family regulator
MKPSIKNQKNQLRKGDGFVKVKKRPLKERLILCAESHQDTMELIIFLLEMNGFKGIPCETTLAALQFARECRFDLYLVTDFFRDGPGLDLVQKIRLFDKQTPLLYFSHIAFSKEIEECVRASVQALLFKPYGIDELVETIRKLIEGDDSLLV